MERNDGDSIRLTVPAVAGAVRVARAGATGLATRAGFSYTEVEEVRLAVSEAAALLVANGSCEDGAGGHPLGVLVVVYMLSPTGLRVELHTEDAEGSGNPRGGNPASDPPLPPMVAAPRVAATSVTETSRSRPATKRDASELAAALLDASVDSWELSNVTGKVVLHKLRRELDED